MREKLTSEEITNRFKDFIDSTGETMNSIASVLSVRQQTISDYRAGKSLPSAKVMTGLAEKYGININWLLTGSGEMYADPLKREFNQNYAIFADTLRDLLADPYLSTTESNFARIGGITEDELDAILAAKMLPPATALRAWAVRYRVNLNFLIAQIGYPLLTVNQYESGGPLSWLRQREAETTYPPAAANPEYAEALDFFEPDFSKPAYEDEPKREKRSLPPEILAPGEDIPLIGIAQCGLSGWSTSMKMAVKTQVPEFRKGMIAAMAIGDSMLPAGIKPGNIVYCDPSLEPETGDPVLVLRRGQDAAHEGDATIKKFVDKDEEWLNLQGWLPRAENEQQKEIYIEQAMSEVETIATVVLIRQRI